MPSIWKNGKNVIKKNQEAVQGAISHPSVTENTKDAGDWPVEVRQRSCFQLWLNPREIPSRQNYLNGDQGSRVRLRVKRTWRGRGGSKRQHNITVLQSTFHMPETVLTAIPSIPLMVPSSLLRWRNWYSKKSSDLLRITWWQISWWKIQIQVTPSPKPSPFLQLDLGLTSNSDTTGCVTLFWLLSFSEPKFPHLRNVANSQNYLRNDMIHSVHICFISSVVWCIETLNTCMSTSHPSTAAICA